MNQQHQTEPAHRGIYLLPNLFTTFAIFAGFFAIVSSMQGKFETSAMAIFVAMAADCLDGRVARMTNTSSEFGAQFDSLSDMVCFGVAPALLAYNWGLYELGKFGWLASFVYTIATALRLAKFNVQGRFMQSHFLGLPCPASAGLIASFIWVGLDFKIAGNRVSEFMALVAIANALLMVSNIKYNSFKKFDLKNRVPFVALVLMVTAYTLIAYDPPKTLFLIAITYALSGPIWYLKNLILNQNETDVRAENPSSDSIVTKIEKYNKR